MSCLSLYCPADFVGEQSPATIPFPRIHKIREATHQDYVVDRARLVYENRCCSQCNAVAVSPIELNDGLINASSQTIPATATVVAFRCNCCYYEWPAR